MTVRFRGKFYTKLKLPPPIANTIQNIGRVAPYAHGGLFGIGLTALGGIALNTNRINAINNRKYYIRPARPHSDAKPTMAYKKRSQSKKAQTKRAYAYLKRNTGPKSRASSRTRRRFGGKRKRKSSKKGLKSFVKKVSLSLCEPKQLRAIEEQQVLGHNIPHFYTGGLNMAYLAGSTSDASITDGDQVWLWDDQFGVADLSVLPNWKHLRTDSMANLTGPSNPAVSQKPIGRYCIQSGEFGALNTNVQFFYDNEGGKRLDRMEGSQICPSKLQYKIKFTTSQNFSVAGSNATYVCVMFRYKTGPFAPDELMNTPSTPNTHILPKRAFNLPPRSNVGWNPWLRCQHVFKGLYGQGASFDDRSDAAWNNGNLPLASDTGPGVSEAKSTEQLAFNCSLRQKDFSVVMTKKFRFAQPFQTPVEPDITQEDARQTPTLSHTVILTHRFKPGKKLNYGYSRFRSLGAGSDPFPDDGSNATLEANIAPDGYNYGVMIYACAEPVVVTNSQAPVAAVSKPENWQWNDDSQSASSDIIGRLATYDIQKSFYYKDP